MLAHILAAVLLIATLGCRSIAPLAHTHASAEELAAAVLTAVERRDEASLRALALDAEEFSAHVWPELPASRPERNLPLAYVWGDLRQKADRGLAHTLASYGGQRLELIDVTFRGGTSQYDSFLVHRDTVLTVTDANGATSDVRLFGSVIDRGGRYKVFSYVID